MTTSPRKDSRSRALLERGQAVIPGGVSSPVRAFKAVGGTPPFIVRAEGAWLEDADGNRYVDFVGSWGPMILGHAHPGVLEAIRAVLASGTSFGAPTELEIELAETIVERVPGVDLVRLVSSGTEATMSAIRVARGVTGRDKIVKFDGCYHGHADSFLIAAGSGALTLGEPNSPGVTKGTAADTLLAKFNDLASVERLFESNPGQIAGLIVEPICGNVGCIPPKKGFLEGLRELCTRHGALLVLDEVMTGFRVARGGAIERYGVDADLATFGKVIGGGMPVGAYAGKREYLARVAPSGPIYQAGTLSGNPVAVTCGLETLRRLTPESYDRLEALGARFEKGVRRVIETNDLPLSWHRVGSMFTLFFTKGPVGSYDDVKAGDGDWFRRFFHAMLDRGVYLAPSSFEAGFLSLAHTPEMLDEVVAKMESALVETREG
jgi:glutamate-1-semialdehyde 2,1-aminomutase